MEESVKRSALEWVRHIDEQRAATVVHVRNGYDILIDRSTKWGNPFMISEENSRKEVIDLYEKYVRAALERDDMELTYEELMEMRGKRLGCWCAPRPCHGDVLVGIIEERLNDAEADNNGKCS
jgi:hypothetical protein